MGCNSIFYEDFKRSECYMPPLRLEEANDGTFLETSFEVQHGRINYRLKNTNTRSKEVWRYHSFDSYATFGQKKSTMIAALKKVDYFASDNSERMVSAIHKLREFKNLDYPNALRREVCEILMQESGNAVCTAVLAFFRRFSYFSYIHILPSHVTKVFIYLLRGAGRPPI